jgi:Uma2 family endonuclease
VTDVLTPPDASAGVDAVEDLEMRLREAYDDLPHEFKVEIVDGELHLLSPSGVGPGNAAGNIFLSLKQYQRRTRAGLAFADGVGFQVDLPGRKSFAPDASFYTGPSRGLGFAAGAPIFAVEVRSEGDYGPRAEAKMARKRDDYFAAGTLVVWDVHTVGADVVRVYRPDRPREPAVFRRGEVADAEPALPGWRLPVDELFE